MKIKCEVEVSRGRLADVLCTGMEGGIHYWGKIVDYVEPPEGSDLFKDLEGWEQFNGGLFHHIHYPMCAAGGGVTIEDSTGEENFPNGAKTVFLDYAALLRGLSLMAQVQPQHFADIVRESEDSITGDVLIQLAVFGEVVFG